jgi:hypothetical protein
LQTGLKKRELLERITRAYGTSDLDLIAGVRERHVDDKHYEFDDTREKDDVTEE